MLTLVTEGKGSEMTVKVGRDLWRSPCPGSPLKLGQDEQIQALERIYLRVKNKRFYPIKFLSYSAMLLFGPPGASLQLSDQQKYN